MMYNDAQFIKDAFTGEINSIRVEKDGRIWFVPLDPANTDYQNIMALVEAGELVIADAEE